MAEERSVKIPEHTILSRLGRGGMASVYLARHDRLGRLVAVKVIDDRFDGDSHFRQRFEREARTAAGLTHPNIVPVHEYGFTDDGRPFLTMAFLEGGSLRERLQKRGPLAVDEALAITRQVAAALLVAHSRNIVHRDLKPDNVLFQGDTALLTDFGIAKVLDASTALTGMGSNPGTVKYFSPEQAKEQTIDQRSDIYTLGVVLQEMLTGSTPTPGDTVMQLIMGIAAKPPEPLPRQLKGLQPFLDVLLSKDPADRLGSCADVIAIIQAMERNWLRFGEVDRLTDGVAMTTSAGRPAGQHDTPVPSSAHPFVPPAAAASHVDTDAATLLGTIPSTGQMVDRVAPAQPRPGDAPLDDGLTLEYRPAAATVVPTTPAAPPARPPPLAIASPPARAPEPAPSPHVPVAPPSQQARATVASPQALASGDRASSAVVEPGMSNNKLLLGALAAVLLVGLGIGIAVVMQDGVPAASEALTSVVIADAAGSAAPLADLSDTTSAASADPTANGATTPTDLGGGSPSIASGDAAGESPVATEAANAETVAAAKAAAEAAAKAAAKAAADAAANATAQAAAEAKRVAAAQVAAAAAQAAADKRTPVPPKPESTGRIPPREWVVGSWEFDGTEFGERVHIIFTAFDDGRARYLMNPGAKNVQKLDGKWQYNNGTMSETFASGSGTGELRMISANEFELRIIDNGDARYRNLKRRYKRT